MINCLRRNGAHWRFFSVSKLFPWYENMIIFHFFYIFIRVENHLISGVIYISSRFDNLTRFHYPPPPPPGYCGAFAHLVSPGGGAFANFALPGARAFANPGAIPKAVSYQNITTKRSLLEKTSLLAHLKRVVEACSRFYARISLLLIKTEMHSEIGCYRRESTFFS